MERVLVFRRGGLGDTLLTVPLLRALRRRDPGTVLHLAGVREFCDVPCAYGTVEVARSSEGLQLWRGERARAALAGYGLVVGDDPAVADRAFDPRQVRPGVPFALQLARQLDLEPHWPGDAQLLAPRARGALSGGGPVVLAPGSGGPAKCWPREHWLALAARLVARGSHIEVVVGPVEVEREDPRAWPWPGPVRFVAGLSPVRLAKQLESAAWFVGNDSGPTHLAAMLGVPTTAVFVATDPEVWAPVGPHVAVVGGVGCLPTVDEVAATA